MTADSSIWDCAVFMAERFGYRLRRCDTVPMGLILMAHGEVMVHPDAATRTVRANTEGSALLPPNR